MDGDDNENMSDDSMQSNVYCFGGNWCTLYPAGGTGELGGVKLGGSGGGGSLDLVCF